MVNNKVLSLFLAGILPFSSQIGIAKAEKNETQSNVKQSSEEKISNAEKYFGWDPNIVYESNFVYLIQMEIDYKQYFVPAKLNAFESNMLLLDLMTKEKIVSIDTSSNNVRLYDYFEKEQEIEVFDCFGIIFFIDDKNFKNDITLGEVADLLVNNKYHNISDFYSKTRLPSLDDLEYNNTVPSKNDGLLIKKKDLLTMSYFETLLEGKWIFLRKINVDENKNSTFIDLFTDEKIAEYKNRKFNFFSNSFKISNEKYRQTGASIERYDPEYYRIMRECIEIIDDEEYYNVGKLRKIYENINLENRYDYSDKLNMKPGSKNNVEERLLGLIEMEDKRINAIDKPKTKELTKKS